MTWYYGDVGVRYIIVNGREIVYSYNCPDPEMGTDLLGREEKSTHNRGEDQKNKTAAGIAEAVMYLN